MRKVTMRYFVSKSIKPLTFSVCGQLNSKDGFLHHRRTFDYHVLILVIEGVLHITANGTEYSLSPDQYLFLRAGEEHFGHQPSVGKLSYLWVHLKAEPEFEILQEPMLSQGASGYTYFFSESGKTASSKRISLLFHQLLDQALEQRLYTTSILDYSVSLLMMELSKDCIDRENPELQQYPPVIFSVTEWIRANYQRPFTLTELADEFHYRADYLSSLFKRVTGVSVIQYTNKIRIETSKTLLTNYDLSIKEAAYSCGFPDEKYYMKLFKKAEGITPTQYKAAFYKKFIN